MSRYPNCSVENCESVAMWQPVALIWNASQNVHDDEPTRIKLKAYICATCMPLMNVNELVSDHGFEKIRKVFKIFGRGKPDRDTMKLDWVAVRMNKS